MKRCRDGKAYWSLLHLTVCLPDICAALQSKNGDTKGALFVAWCNQFLKDPLLNGDETYMMRCKVLHQGRAVTGKTGRYSGFSFGQPASHGTVDHKRVDGPVLHLDVGEFSNEVKQAVERWIQHIESNSNSAEALAVEKNLPSLVRINAAKVPVPSGLSGTNVQIAVIHKTN